jgi:hypothetical protein
MRVGGTRTFQSRMRVAFLSRMWWAGERLSNQLSVGADMRVAV